VSKTLLLIICDFLLISILALVEFEPDVQTDPVDEAGLRDDSAEEMLELMQLSLEHENQQREAIESDLDQTREALSEREQALQEKDMTLAEREAALREREASLQEVSRRLQEQQQTTAELDSELEQTRSSLQLTRQEKEELARSLEEREARARQLQEELRAQQEEAADKEAALAQARRNLDQLEAQQQQLSTQLQIRETEKEMLQQNLIAARAEVDRARIEAERAQEQTENLAAGVSELAQSSTRLEEEIKRAQPLSLNAIYKRFEDNRVFLRFRWEESGFLSSTERQAALQTILVQTDDGVRALFATANTPFADGRRDRDPEAIMTIGGRSFAVKEIGFLASDPAIAGIRIPERIASESDLEIFSLSDDPFRFSDAVLVSDDEELYGEIPVRVPPGETGTLEVESRLFNRLFGEFSPSAGNYVFSMTGGLVGIMVSGNRARMLQNPQLSSFRELRPPERQQSEN
jgi:hypothetical protein